MVESDPEALADIRDVLNPVEGELWNEADEIVERPDRWAEVGRSWGPRAQEALQSCIR